MPQAFWGTQSAGAAAWGAAAAASSGRFGSSLRKRCGQVPPDPTLESPFEEMALVKGGWLWRQNVQPPEGRSRDGLLTVNLREGSRLHLCAETKDDAIAWKTALLEASSTPAPTGATVPPRSRRICPKVRCVTRSWSPCKVERRIWVRVYSPYQDYYEVVPPNAHEATYIRSYYGPPYAGPGVTHVVVREDPCYSAGAPLAMGMLAGAATGAALGSLMWSPCWF
uniref:pleckstrin homology domain-containing family B member 1 isoform X6 n=1 Tax=Halichoerus grypus TaxID=9711 RepID=UPI001658F17D|nr:pleckstrin homology domain-containing family B member 1 isoform X6 [Halichoerus grypus]